MHHKYHGTNVKLMKLTAICLKKLVSVRFSFFFSFSLKCSTTYTTQKIFSLFCAHKWDRTIQNDTNDCRLSAEPETKELSKKFFFSICTMCILMWSLIREGDFFYRATIWNAWSFLFSFLAFECFEIEHSFVRFSYGEKIYLQFELD